MFKKIQTGVFFDLLKITSLLIQSDSTSKAYFESYERIVKFKFGGPNFNIPPTKSEFGAKSMFHNLINTNYGLEESFMLGIIKPIIVAYLTITYLKKTICTISISHEHAPISPCK